MKLPATEEFDKTQRDYALNGWAEWLARYRVMQRGSFYDEDACVRVIGYCLGLAGRGKDEQGVRRCR